MDTTQENDSLVQLLAELVAFKTVTGENKAACSCLDYAETFLQKRGMQVYRHESQNFPSLVATTQKTKKPKVLLQAHLDVVPCRDELCKIEERDGRLIGRGVYDMKFAAAVFLKLVDELKSDLSEYDFGIMFTCDEEIGGKHGVRALLEQGYGAEVCVLPDAGDNWQIEATQKGAWIVRLHGEGATAHGSRPWEGDNVIHRLLVALQDFQTMFSEQHAKSDTLSINQIEGGMAMNQVADQAEATLDIRFMDRSAYERLKTKLEEIAETHGLEVETIACVMPVKTDMENPYVKSFLQLAEEVHGSPLGEIHSLGSSDAHYFAELGIPIILLRPTGGAAHSDTEWVDKASLGKYYELIKSYVQKEARLAR